MIHERLLIQLPSVEAVLYLLQVEVIVGHPVMLEQALLGVDPEALDPVDRARPRLTLPALRSFVRLPACQFSKLAPR